MILHSGTPIGFMNCMIDPRWRVSVEPNTAWISLAIGENRARGQGFARPVMEKLE